MRIAFVGDSLTLGVPGCSYLDILRKRVRDHTLINLGRGNDTVISLYRRMTRLRVDNPFDMAFLWVGVNDVSTGASRLAHVVNAVRGQPRAQDLDEFRTYYRLTLDLLCVCASRVIAVSPALKGEKIDTEWNRRLDDLAGVIEDLVACREGAAYLDLRSTFVRELAGKQASDYLLVSPLQVVLDVLTLRSREQIDRKAVERGLYLTLDGVHLNGRGAGIVARAFQERIDG